MPRSSREKSAETRTRIVNAAYQSFLEHGYAATPMRDIADRAGVTVGAIYNHFATKEDIWIEVLTSKHPYHEILPLMQTVQGDSLAELIHSAAHGLVNELRHRPDLLNLLFIEFVEFKSKHIPDLYRLILPELSKLNGILESKPGHLRQVPTSVLLRSFVGLFFSYVITGFLFNEVGGISIDPTSLDQVIDLYLYGVLPEDDPSRINKTPHHGPVFPGRLEAA